MPSPSAPPPPSAPPRSPSGQRGSLAAGASGGLVVLLCLLTCFICRVWRRNRYYSKVQRTLDEEERAFQECALATAPQAYFHRPKPGVHHHTPRRNPSNPSMLSRHPLCGTGRWHGTIVRRAWSWTATTARSSTCLRATWPAWAARRRREARRARRLRRAACSNAPSLAADHAATHWSVQRRACLPGQPSGPEGRARAACMPERGYGGARVPVQSCLSHLTAFVTAQAPMPTNVEDVDKFMQDLAAAAQGRRPPDDEAEAVEGEPSARI